MGVVFHESKGVVFAFVVAIRALQGHWVFVEHVFTPWEDHRLRRLINFFQVPLPERVLS